MNKINLLYVITKLELGGAQKHLLSLIAGLNKERFNVFLFTAQDGLLLQEAFLMENLKIQKSRFLERSINPLKDLLALFELCLFIRNNGIDIVHTHSSKAGILGRWAANLAGVKHILHTVHGWSFNDFQTALVRSLYIFLERITAVFTDKLIVVSYYDKQKGLNNRIAREDKYEVIRYGIAHESFGLKDFSVREELGIKPGDFTVGMVSCFKPQKSPQDFVRMAALIKQALPNTKFILVGEGELRRPVEDLISKSGLKQDLILTGWRKDIPRLLSAMDVFVLTSLWEGLPISVLEAMAASLPIVATDTGGISEVVLGEKTGFLVPPGDVEKIARKVILLLNDEALRKQTGRNAQQFLVSGFAEGQMIEKTRCLYEYLIKD